MVSLSSEQQEILEAIRSELTIVNKGKKLGDAEVMKKHDLVRAVCEKLRINGHETALKVYDVLRMLELREVQL